jgi:hypothetical protein
MKTLQVGEILPQDQFGKKKTLKKDEEKGKIVLGA